MGKHGVGRKLLDLKDQLERKQAQRSEDIGEYKSHMSRLNKDFDITKLEEIDDYLEGLDEDIRTMEEKMGGIVVEIEAEFEKGIE